MREVIDNRSVTQTALRRSPVPEREWIVSLLSSAARSASPIMHYVQDAQGTLVPRVVKDSHTRRRDAASRRDTTAVPFHFQAPVIAAGTLDLS